MVYYWVVCSIIVMVRWDDRPVNTSGWDQDNPGQLFKAKPSAVCLDMDKFCPWPGCCQSRFHPAFFPIAVVPSLSGSTALVDRATFPRKDLKSSTDRWTGA